MAIPISHIITAVVSVAAGISIGYYLKTGSIDIMINTITKLAEIIVKSTEQQFGDEPGQNKKSIAMNKLYNEMQSLGYKPSKSLAKEAVESAVKDMDK